MGLFDKKKKTAVAETDAKAEEKAAVATKKADKETKPAKADKSAASSRQGVYGVLISPLISEKSTREEQYGKYVFAVSAGATKSEIAKAVETSYGVKPVKVNVINRLGKAKRSGRIMGRRKDWRKAVVTLAKGKSINVYETNK